MVALMGRTLSIQQWANEGPACAITFSVTYDTRI